MFTENLFISLFKNVHLRFVLITATFAFPSLCSTWTVVKVCFYNDKLKTAGVKAKLFGIGPSSYMRKHVTRVFFLNRDGPCDPSAHLCHWNVRFPFVFSNAVAGLKGFQSKIPFGLIYADW